MQPHLKLHRLWGLKRSWLNSVTPSSVTEVAATPNYKIQYYGGTFSMFLHLHPVGSRVNYIQGCPLFFVDKRFKPASVRCGAHEMLYRRLIPVQVHIKCLFVVVETPGPTKRSTPGVVGSLRSCVIKWKFNLRKGSSRKRYIKDIWLMLLFHWLISSRGVKKN